MLPYTPYTSEILTSGVSVAQDLSSFAGAPSFPSGKQVIFFSLGIILTIASIALIIRALIGDEIPPELVAKLATVA